MQACSRGQPSFRPGGGAQRGWGGLASLPLAGHRHLQTVLRRENLNSTFPLFLFLGSHQICLGSLQEAAVQIYSLLIAPFLTVRFSKDCEFRISLWSITLPATDTCFPQSQNNVASVTVIPVLFEFCWLIFTHRLIYSLQLTTWRVRSVVSKKSCEESWQNWARWMEGCLRHSCHT